MPGLNAITWFEIGTDDPARAERFYGEVFGWTVAYDPEASGDPAYQLISTGAGSGLPAGGLFNTKGDIPGYAVFHVLVADVAATCRHVEEAGGSVLRPPEVNSVGFAFAHLLDPSGNHLSRSSRHRGRGAGTSAVTVTAVTRSVRNARTASRLRHQATRYQCAALQT